jgi:hypothetical protein
MGASPTPFATIGSTGIVTGVYASVVCRNAVAPFDTAVVSGDPVSLNAEGDAQFEGTVVVHTYCQLNPGSLALLLRVASQSPAPPTVPNIVGLWLAHGAARSQ